MQKSDDVERARQLVEKARVAEQHEETAKAMGLYDDALASSGKTASIRFFQKCSDGRERC